MEICLGKCYLGVLIVLVWGILVALHVHRTQRAGFEPLQRLLGPLRGAASRSRTPRTFPPPGAKMERLFWFVQISDIHISSFDEGWGRQHLELFLNSTLKLVKPLFVAATGDLTDAKEKPGPASRQYAKEWNTYRGVLARNGVFNRSDFWFDIRGNHDNFNVASWHSPVNYYRNFSVQKRASYWHEFDLGFGKYGLIAIDGCPDHGNSRPMNFFGALDKTKMDELEGALGRLRAANHTFVISHYPVVTMQFQRSSRGASFASLSKTISAHLSGHLHRLALGLGRHLYARQPTGFLDLELNDIKDHKMFRIVAVDHDVISFGDFGIDEAPFVLVTNPSDARFLIPAHEDVRLALRSSHIRVLIFSPSARVVATVRIDSGEAIPLENSPDGGVLFVAPWNPDDYRQGLHRLVVAVKLEDGSERVWRQSFSLDGSVDRIGTFGEALMLFPLMDATKAVFWATLIGLLGLYIFLAIYRWRLLRGSASGVDLWIYQSCQRLRRDEGYLSAGRLLEILWIRLVVFYCRTRTCHLMMLFNLYCAVGPIAAAPLATEDQHCSVVFPWGIWSPEHGWADMFDTWALAALLLATQWLPGLFLAAFLETDPILYRNVIELTGHPPLLPAARHRSLVRWGFSCGVVMVWWLSCFKRMLFLARSYGVLWVLFGFGNSWHLLWCTGIVLWNLQFFLAEMPRGGHGTKVE